MPDAPAPVPDAPPRPRGRLAAACEEVLRRAQFAHPRTALASGAALVALMVGGSLIPVPYVIEQPGPAIDVLGRYDDADIITATGHETFPSQGRLMMTTVSVDGGPGFTVTPAQVMMAWFDRTRAVYPREVLFPEGSTREDVALENSVQMSTSQQGAVAVALDELGIDYERTVVVAGLQADAPASGVLESGDEILAIAGRSAPDIAGYQELTAAAPPGEPLAVTVRRDGQERELSVPTAVVDGATRMGIVLADGYEFPFDVHLAVGDIGGPSAGLMFSLGIYDELTEGALPGGKDIAGTGTIAADGSVGAIGGIRQKMVGAREAGADFFLAPGANCEEVTGYEPGGLQVVRVDTFDQALHATRTIADTGSVDGLPTCEDS
ncbi:YlbL family protein [Brachybacterium hainanense]|uniref:endopeptidase La n=1 Tax=Brachybacterium hainanense TaxID=1541174 RepID=A0ABV6RFH1_9MICO